MFGALADDDNAIGTLATDQIDEPIVHGRHNFLQEHAVAALSNGIRKVTKYLH